MLVPLLKKCYWNAELLHNTLCCLENVSAVALSIYTPVVYATAHEQICEMPTRYFCIRIELDDIIMVSTCVLLEYD